MKQAMPGIIIKTCMPIGRPASLAIRVCLAGQAGSQGYDNNLQMDTFKQNINK